MVMGKLKAAYKNLTDADKKIARDEARHKERIRKMANKTEREAAKAKLQVETMKRKKEVAEAKAALRSAQADQSLAGAALDKARQAHARSILDWSGVFVIKGPSAKTKKQIASGAKSVGKAALSFWDRLGRDALSEKPKGSTPKRKTTKAKPKKTAKKKTTTTKKKSTTKKGKKK